MINTDISENRGRDGYHHYGTPPKRIGQVGDEHLANSDVTVFACADSEIGPFIEIVGREMTDEETGNASRGHVIVELADAVDLATHIIKAAASLGYDWNSAGAQNK